MKLRYPDGIKIYGGDGVEAASSAKRASVKLRAEGKVLRVTLEAKDTSVSYIRLRWNFSGSEVRREPVRVLGDAWERGYGDLEWRGIVPQRCMPWFFMVSNGSDTVGNVSGRLTECFGVTVRPSALCFWQYDGAGVTLWLDVRCGGRGVELGGRALEVCGIIFEDYHDMTAYGAGKLFCAELCPDRLTTARPVYGSNNWYYAYGNSSHGEIIGDTKLLMKLCEGIDNPPYMVIDDGWQPNRCDAPWVGNERFPDMAGLAAEMSGLGAIPGVWVRYLTAKDPSNDGVIPEEWRAERNRAYLDPSIPEVLDYVRETTARLTGWGYKLIKHDFSTFDMFGFWGMQRPFELAADGWSFRDKTKTSAEIVVALNRAIYEAAGAETVLIGCNTIGHLCAGLVHLNRTGDDTSGREWERTRKMGVNTLAFRGLHNGTFYASDADCLGVTESVPWELNRRWMELLARSGSPMFVSCKPSALTPAMAEELSRAYRVNSAQRDELVPLDWMENMCPALWTVNGERTTFDWYTPDGADTFRPKL